MQTANQLRSEFLGYFKKNGHTVVESSGLIPHNDPTLLFTNAGMNPFKDVFLGTDKRNYNRAASSQKCVRAGGKHNDLENVGFTARHHTFFEMLGNFSFGDYFKKEAIHFAWEFVTENIGLSKDKLYVSVYKDDDDAALIWEKQESVSKDRISRFGEKDNFWSMGDTGPCGPCSEIFVDRGEKYGCGKSSCAVGCDCDRFMEIWNLVFMQFNKSADGKMTPLPKPSIDTGMGLERLASVVQGVATNYDTDLFQTLIDSMSELAKVKYGKSQNSDVSLRVLADHCRATNFLISDGVLPSNEGRGYVLRRIMRRAIRHGRQLGFRDPFFYKFTKPLIDLMGNAYPELKDKREYLESTIKLEEEKFLITLDNGLKILEEEMAKTSQSKISGETCFRLYDTFGFPLDLTQVIAKEKGFSVDEQGFEKCMDVQRERSREHWKGSGDESVGELYKELNQKGFKTKFRGYDTMACSGKILALIEEGKFVKQTSTGSFKIIVDETPFYAESGGQVGDHGEITLKEKSICKVTDVKKPVGDFFVINCEQATGSLKVGDAIEQKTDQYLRACTAKNHTATHMLQHALQKILGPHVKQAGSLVSSELLRFDFTHPKAMTDEEIMAVEDFINESIARCESVASEEMEKEKALAKGAIAFFGDKYGDKVRVISVGKYSVELCGGTHVKNTSDVQLFKIINENGIASGVRRIVAITGPAVLKHLRTQEKWLSQIMTSMKASAIEEVPIKIEKLIATEKELKKTIENQNRKSQSQDMDQWIKNSVSITHGVFISGVVQLSEGENGMKALRDLGDLLRSKVKTSVIAIAAKDLDKDQGLLVIGVTKDLISKYSAGDLIKKILPFFEGSGGGKPELAQAGGKNCNFDHIFDKIKSNLS